MGWFWMNMCILHNIRKSLNLLLRSWWGTVKLEYAEYYTRLQKEMPGELASIDAQRLCEAIGVPISRTVDATDSEFKEKRIARGEERSTGSILLCAFVIIGLIVVSIVLSFC